MKRDHTRILLRQKFKNDRPNITTGGHNKAAAEEKCRVTGTETRITPVLCEVRDVYNSTT